MPPYFKKMLDFGVLKQFYETDLVIYWGGSSYSTDFPTIQFWERSKEVMSALFWKNR